VPNNQQVDTRGNKQSIQVPTNQQVDTTSNKESTGKHYR